MSGWIKATLAAGLLLLVVALSPVAWRWVVNARYSPRIYSLNDAPNRPAAIVFGAAILPNGRLSTVLRDRMDTAIALYESQRVQKILVTGAGTNHRIDEATAMARYAESRGVPMADILIDSSGRRTYDSCYAAANGYKLSSAVLVTQAFHLPRALFTCERLGMEVIGVAADFRQYRAARWYEFRETAATLIALYDVLRRQPPNLGG